MTAIKDFSPPIRYVPEPELDPIEESIVYVRNEWFQLLTAVRTRCYRCKQLSPVVHVPWGDPAGETLAFGNPRLLRQGGKKKHDITKDTVAAFAEVGWKFQLRRAYCPTCKGLGSVA